ncbi:MAG: hypothetical protein ABWZ88_18495 [Variovorax sp.]
MRLLHAIRRFPTWLVVGVLAVCLPLQAVSAAVASLLGARHSHRAAIVEQVVEDNGAGESRMHGITHGQAHRLGIRHHHDFDDPSVLFEEPGTDIADGGPSSEATPAGASFVFVPAAGAANLAPAPEACTTAWRKCDAALPTSPDPQRLDRPPQHDVPA